MCTPRLIANSVAMCYVLCPLSGRLPFALRFKRAAQVFVLGVNPGNQGRCADD